MANESGNRDFQEKKDARTRWPAVLLASGVISVLASLFYNHFFVPRKDIFAIDREYGTFVIQAFDRGRNNETLPTIDMLQNIILPLYEAEPKYIVLTINLIKFYSSKLSDTEGTRTNAVITSEELVRDLESDNSLQLELDADNIRNAFAGPLRRQYSDFIVQNAEIEPMHTAEALIDAIIRDVLDVRKYRVNLYICYTLARLSNVPDLGEKLTEAMAVLTDSREYEVDPTYKARCDAAAQKLNAS